MTVSKGDIDQTLVSLEDYVPLFPFVLPLRCSQIEQWGKSGSVCRRYLQEEDGSVPHHQPKYLIGGWQRLSLRRKNQV